MKLAIWTITIIGLAPVVLLSLLHVFAHFQIARNQPTPEEMERDGVTLTFTESVMEAQVTATYIGRLESEGAAPGIDLVARLAAALGTTVHDLLPTTSPPDTDTGLRERAEKLFGNLLKSADRETLLMLNPLLARLIDASRRSR